MNFRQRRLRLVSRSFDRVTHLDKMCPRVNTPPKFQVTFYRYNSLITIVEGWIYGRLTIQYHMTRPNVTQEELNALRQAILMELEDEFQASPLFYGLTANPI
jgi:hypothetical protein